MGQRKKAEHRHKPHEDDDEDGRSAIAKRAYRQRLRALQIELVKLQKHVIAKGLRVLVIIEGRDTAGKDGLIKRIVQHASPRETRVVALGKPSDRETSEWYFQRFVPYLPAACELVLFNRSWYNRAGVERVMGFCREGDYRAFMEAVCPFEEMLVRDGLVLCKYYLDVSHAEQARRLKDRRTDPLKQWKRSPVDDAALKHWDDYSKARDAMLAATSHRGAVWTIVRADDKRAARLDTIADLLSRIDFHGKDKKLARPDPKVVFPFTANALKEGALSP